MYALHATWHEVITRVSILQRSREQIITIGHKRVFYPRLVIIEQGRTCHTCLRGEMNVITTVFVYVVGRDRFL